MDKLTEWLSQFDEEEQERLIRYALDHIVPRMKKSRAALAEPVADEPVTSGHCANKKQPGGCPLHNLHCGYPACDTRPAAAPADHQAAVTSESVEPKAKAKRTAEGRADNPESPARSASADGGLMAEAVRSGIRVCGHCNMEIVGPVRDHQCPDGEFRHRGQMAPAERGEYPPLPEPDHWMRNGYARFEPHPDAVACYTADQMRTYVDADRAQRAKP